MTPAVIWTMTAVALVLVVLLGAMPLKRLMRRREEGVALKSFRLQRELLEAKFFDLAGSLGKQRGLRWKECDWQPAVTFARDCRTHLLTAFVAVDIHFEAIAGGDMEDVAAVDTVRDAVALFHYEQGRWGTGGRALFNMNPEDAIIRFKDQYEPIIS